MKKRLRYSGNTANVVQIDSVDPDPNDIRTATDILGQKGVLVFPTSGLYGLGADAFCAEAVRRVFTIKRRPAHKPLLLLLAGIYEMAKVVQTVPDYAQLLLGLCGPAESHSFSRQAIGCRGTLPAEREKSAYACRPTR